MLISSSAVHVLWCLFVSSVATSALGIVDGRDDAAFLSVADDRGRHLAQMAHDSVDRALQRGLQDSGVGVVGAASPSLLCNGFQASGEYACECGRFDLLDVYAACEATTPICTDDGTFCRATSFETIYRAAEVTYSWMKTCSKAMLLIEPMKNTSSCIEVEPTRVGYFNETVRCKATIGDRVCNSCSQCSGTESADVPSTITADCCNVEEDAKMTCGLVDGSGATTFVADPPGTHKDCSGGMTWFGVASGSIVIMSLFVTFVTMA